MAVGILGFQQCRVMFRSWDYKRAAQHRRGIGFTATGGNRVAEHAASKGAATTGGFMLAMGFEALECGQDIDGLERGNWLIGNRLQLLQQPMSLADRGFGSSIANHLFE